MYNFPHYLEKTKWELNSLLGFKICIGFLRIVIIGRLFQCCSLARIGSGFFLGFFCVCERLKTHLSCYHGKHVFLLIHTGVPVRVSSTEMLSLLLAHQASNKYLLLLSRCSGRCAGIWKKISGTFSMEMGGFPSGWRKKKPKTTKSQSWKQSFSLEETCSFWPILFRNVPICNAVSSLRPCWLYGSSVIPEVSWATQLRRRGEGRELCQSCLWWGIGRPLTICISMLASSLPVSRS